MDKVQQEVDKLYKSHYGKMVASLLYFSQDIDLETAEDLVQDSFSAALTAWKEDSYAIQSGRVDIYCLQE